MEKKKMNVWYMRLLIIGLLLMIRPSIALYYRSAGNSALERGEYETAAQLYDEGDRYCNFVNCRDMYYYAKVLKSNADNLENGRADCTTYIQYGYNKYGIAYPYNGYRSQEIQPVLEMIVKNNQRNTAIREQLMRAQQEEERKQLEKEKMEQKNGLSQRAPFVGMYAENINDTRYGKCTSYIRYGSKTKYAWINSAGEIVMIVYTEGGKVSEVNITDASAAKLLHDGVDNTQYHSIYHGIYCPDEYDSHSYTPSTHEKTDPYNISEYGFFEDWYEDYFDEFYDEEDAEMYWLTHSPD